MVIFLSYYVRTIIFPDIINKYISQVLCFFLFLKFIYLSFFFLAALGLRCAQAFSSCGEQRLLFLAVRRLLIVVASLVVEHGL